MGITNRDYLGQDDSYLPWGHDVPVCRGLLIGTVIVYVLQLVTPTGPAGPFALRSSLVDEWFALDLASLKTGQIWRLVSYAFLHDRYSIFHILFNMLWLWWFGPTLERMRGSREFLLFYLAAALFSGLGFLGWGLATGQLASVTGASGAVLAVVMLYTCYYPRERIGLFFGLIFIEMRWMVLLITVVTLHPMLLALSGEADGSNVAHSAHLFGLLFGYLYKRWDWELSEGIQRLRVPNLMRSWRRAKTRRQLRVFKPEDDHQKLDAQVDAILAKIHEQGTESLTAKERAVLAQASERYKQRQP